MPGGYESWFVSARDPASRRALWIRHTRLQPSAGPESAALWCMLADPDLGPEPVVVKQVFGTLPATAVAGPARFRGTASMAGQQTRWDLAITDGQPELRPLQPAMLYRAPLPRTKVVASVPDGLVSGVIEAAGHRLEVDQWRGTVGHNWGREHADRWVWLHVGFGAAGTDWLELVLARIKVGRVRLPWTAMGAISLGGERIRLGGLGRRVLVRAAPGQLTASIPAPGGRLHLRVSSHEDDAVGVVYVDPPGGTRLVRHAGLATVNLRIGRRGVAIRGIRGAYEYGTSEDWPGITPRSLPEG